MSAHIVSQKHISAMLQAISFNRYRGSSPSYRWNNESKPMLGSGRANQLGQILWEENYRSVNYRYDDNQSCPKFSVLRGDSYTAAQIINLIDCYIYQSSESPDFQDTEAYAIAQSLREKAISRLVSLHSEADNIWSI